MNINKNNYEAFFLDYYEGNLTTEQVAELLLFIEQHPEHKEEFESFENISFADNDSLTFENKASLKKEVTADNIEEYFSKYVDGTLTKTEIELLNTYIKQHPQYQADLALYQKTKIHPDLSIVFENKDDLKKIDAMDEILISSIEGLLSKEEKSVLDKQLATDSKLKNELLLFEQTKLEANKFIVYPNKEDLKRKERKAIPLFYYVAAAVSIALLFSLFIIFNNNTPEKQFAETAIDSTKQDENNSTNAMANSIIKKENTQLIEPKIINVEKQVAVKVKNTTQNISSNDTISSIPELNNTTTNNMANVNQENKEEKVIPENNDKPQLAIVQQPTNNNVEEKVESIKKSMEFLTLRELAVEKIKAKTIDEETLTEQKKSGKDKKLSGWDLAQMVTKGISKVTGRNMELKPKYNDQGDVTAYALGNGIQIARKQ